MKKLLLMLASIFILVACTTQVPESYNTIEKTIYNLNPDAKDKIVSNEVNSASIRLIELTKSLSIKDNNSQFKIEVANDGLSVNIINTDGSKKKLTTDNGFEIIKTIDRDTLFVSYFPTKATPDNLLKYAIEYKFYNIINNE